MISIRNLHKRQGGRETLAGATVEIGEGETVAVVGASGCGKTTLLRCLNALEPFDQGEVRVAGFSLAPRPTALFASDLGRLRTAVGMVFQELHLFPHLTVLENVTLAPRVVKGEAHAPLQKRALDLLERVGLPDRASAYPHELSGGQRQRVALVRALLPEPRVLLLDEPTSALDPSTADGVARTLSELTRGRVTVVLVTHQAALASSLGDRVLRLEHGLLNPAP